MMPRRNLGPRAEYRQQEKQRADSSPALAEKFPQLESLSVDLAFGNAEGRGQPTQMKYRVNIANARSVFRLDCPNSECIGGDFDLSDALTDAYSQKLTSTNGELLCQGWRSKTAIGRCRCGHTLRYRLNLEYDDGHSSNP